MNFAHLKKEMLVLVEGEGERGKDGKVSAESKTQKKQGQQEHHPARITDLQEQQEHRQKQNPHTAARSFSRSSTILALPELGDYATPQDVWCYGCVNASVDAPGTVDESWWCMRRGQGGEGGNGDCGGDQGEGQEFVFKPVRSAYCIGDCPLVKKGSAHREVADG